MTSKCFLWRSLLLLTLLAGCTGARSPQATFYTLSPLPDNGTGYQEQVEALQGRVIGVGPVSFPDYADRPQLVTRRGPNRMEIEEMHQWAGSVREDFANVIVQNMTLLLKTDLVFPYPWKRAVPVDRQVTIDVIRFDGTPGGQATLVAHWAVVDKVADTAGAMRRTRLVDRVTMAGHEGVVQALSRLVGRLSEEIVDEVKG